jgi:hypothetical protein
MMSIHRRMFIHRHLRSIKPPFGIADRGDGMMSIHRHPSSSSDRSNRRSASLIGAMMMSIHRRISIYRRPPIDRIAVQDR